ncbi:MAG: hypothetical protein AAFN63_11820 [Pseudomonadota bacterium]
MKLLDPHWLYDATVIGANRFAQEKLVDPRHADGALSARNKRYFSNILAG